MNMNKLSIGLIAPTEDPLKLPNEFNGYGGTERVLAYLVEGLVSAGIEVHLFAPGDTNTNAILHPTLPVSLRKAYSPEELQVRGNDLKMNAIRNALLEIEKYNIDLIDNHYSWRVLSNLNLINIPLVTMVHSDISSPDEKKVFGEHKHEKYISISNSQRNRMPNLNWIKTIYHGEDISKFEVGDIEKRTHLTFIGRTSIEKGLGDLIQEVKKTNYQLKIAAKIGPDKQSFEYHETMVKPFIDNKQIIWLGEIGDNEKKELLKTSQALIISNNTEMWQEPSGLVAIEAMSAGVPVIATKSGALTETIIDGKTGFLIDDISQLGNVIENINSINPQDCRSRIENHFSIDKMVQEYIFLYKQILNV